MIQKNYLFIGLLTCILFSGYSQVLVNDINKNTGTNDANGALRGSSPKNFIEFNNEIYFLASDTIPVLFELFKNTGDDMFSLSDSLGLEDNLLPTERRKSIEEITVFKDSIFFLYRDKLYKTDGVSILDEVPLNRPVTITTPEPISRIMYLTVFRDKLYFRGFTTGSGTELFAYSDGQVSMVPEIRNVNQGTESFKAENLIATSSTLYYQKQNQDRWWSYTGTGDPKLVGGKSFTELFDYIVYKDQLYFAAMSTATLGSFSKQEELVLTVNSSNVIEIPNGLNTVFNVFELGIYKNRLVLEGDFVTFTKSEPFLGFYNGSTLSRVSKTGFYKSRSYQENNDTLYFTAGENGTNDFELWRYVDGNTPEKVFNINPLGNSLPQDLFSFNNNLFFSANDGETGRELWAIGPDYQSGITGFFDFGKKKSKLMVYPNPADHILHTWKGQVTIVNTMGEIVLQQYSEGEIDISYLPIGTYSITNGKRTEKIVIQ